MGFLKIFAMLDLEASKTTELWSVSLHNFCFAVMCWTHCVFSTLPFSLSLGAVKLSL